MINLRLFDRSDTSSVMGWTCQEAQETQVTGHRNPWGCTRTWRTLHLLGWDCRLGSSEQIGVLRRSSGYGGFVGRQMFEACPRRSCQSASSLRPWYTAKKIGERGKMV